MTIAERIIEFNKSLEFQGELPEGIKILNPYKESPYIFNISSAFYSKFYNDNFPRYFIIGINPGRLGGGITGIPFTDTKRLSIDCDILYHGPNTHELSSVFVYEMIKQFGGVDEFYSKFYFGAVCPLGFTETTPSGKVKNYNYYDSKALLDSVYSFIVSGLEKQMEIGLIQEVCFCLGTGKNFQFLSQLNNKYRFFKQIVQLEHPRYIMQYKRSYKEEYIQKYLHVLNKVLDRKQL